MKKLQNFEKIRKNTIMGKISIEIQANTNYINVENHELKKFSEKLKIFLMMLTNTTKSCSHKK